MNLKAEHLKPAVNKPILLFLSGIMWLCVGIMLNTFAIHWLIAYGRSLSLLFAGIGFVISLVIHHFGFLKIADKNLGRINNLNAKPCLFSFMSWKSYIIVAIMVSLGITLRHSTIPKQFLAIIYIGIGLALIFSSIRYFRALIAVIWKE
ncbi:MAG TPA: hypothetical protein DIW31_11580 [Bacteroidales bacterium]|nr:hypothetical protein [Bacteroidales bacterium]